MPLNGLKPYFGFDGGIRDSKLRVDGVTVLDGSTESGETLESIVGNKN